jgi:hypothetical protein
MSDLNTERIRQTYSKAGYADYASVGKNVLDTVAALCDEVDRLRRVVDGAMALIPASSPAGHSMDSDHDLLVEVVRSTRRANEILESILSQQSSLDAAVTELDTDLTALVADIQAEVAALEAAQAADQPLDFTNLNSLVAQADAAVAANAPPAPPVTVNPAQLAAISAGVPAAAQPTPVAASDQIAQVDVSGVDIPDSGVSTPANEGAPDGGSGTHMNQPPVESVEHPGSDGPVGVSPPA